jgi:hypothetical protein
MSVGPKMLKSIEVTLLGGHEVNENTRVIHNDPTTIRRPFSPEWTNTLVFSEFLIDGISGSPELTRVIDRSDNKTIGDR